MYVRTYVSMYVNVNVYHTTRTCCSLRERAPRPLVTEQVQINANFSLDDKVKAALRGLDWGLDWFRVGLEQGLVFRTQDVLVFRFGFGCPAPK